MSQLSSLSRVGKITVFGFLVFIVLLGYSLAVSSTATIRRNVNLETSNSETGYYVSAASAGAVAAKATWNVPMASACNTNNFVGVFAGLKTGGHQDGIYTKISCSGKGAMPSYSVYGEYRGTTFPIGSTMDVIRPGDKLSYTADFTIKHSLKITFADLTRGWTYSSSGLTDTVTPKGQAVYVLFMGPVNSLPLKFSKLTFSSLTATLGSRTGSLGSFSSSSLFSFNYVSSYVDTANGHTLAMSGPLNSLGNSFGVTFLRTN